MNHGDHEPEYNQDMDVESERQIGRQPRYLNEDTSPTSKREVMGWYCYGIAAEVFAICGVGSFLPVTIESLAREEGVLLSDKTTSCIKSTIPVNAIRSLTSILSRDHNDTDGNGQCIVSFFGAEVNSASYALYTFSLAVFIQALVLVSFSGVADHGDYRKRLLLGFGFGGSTAVMLFLLVAPQIFVIGSVLAIVSISCLGSSFVVLNSFLPLLVANDPVIAESKKDIAMHTFPSSSDEGPSPGDSLFDHETEVRNREAEGAIRLDTPSTITNRPSFSLPMLSPGFRETEKKVAPELQLSTQISSRGVALGYGAAVFVQIISIAVLLASQKMTSSTTLPLRIVLFIVGLWWFLFTIPVSLWLRDRPGPPLKSIQKTANPSRLRSLLTYTIFAWSSLFKTIKIAFKLRQVRVFLVAWFLLSDAIATIAGTAILFAKTELKMETPSIAVISMVVTISGILGAFSWPKISHRYGLQSNQTILCCIFIFELVPLWGLVGYLPIIQRLGFLGLQQPWEVFPLAFIHGFVMGGLSSYCRAFFGALIPPGSESAFYALYAITDKGSSAFGPAIVGRIIDTTGEIRVAFVFLAVLVLLPVPLIWSVNADKGKEDALNMAEVLRKGQGRSGVAVEGGIWGGVEGVEDADLDGVVSGTREEEAEGLLADLVERD